MIRSGFFKGIADDRIYEAVVPYDEFGAGPAFCEFSLFKQFEPGNEKCGLKQSQIMGEGRCVPRVMELSQLYERICAGCAAASRKRCRSSAGFEIV